MGTVSTDAIGVIGFSVNESGIGGVTSSSDHSGAFGVNQSTGPGVSGISNLGIGVRAVSSGGTTLQADGPVKFSTAGQATIPKNKSSAKVDIRVDVTGVSIVLATLQSDPGGGVLFSHVETNAGGNSFTVHLTGKAQKTTKVAYFLIG